MRNKIKLIREIINEMPKLELFNLITKAIIIIIQISNLFDNQNNFKFISILFDFIYFNPPSFKSNLFRHLKNVQTIATLGPVILQ